MPYLDYDPKDILFIGMDPGTDRAHAVQQVWLQQPGKAPELVKETSFPERVFETKPIEPTPEQQKILDILRDPKKFAEHCAVTKRATPGVTTMERLFAGYPNLHYRVPMPAVHRAERIARANPPSVSVKLRKSGTVLVTVNLSRGGFTCFLKPPAPPQPDTPCTNQWTFGFAFRAPTDEPSSIGKDTASKRCGQFNAGTKRSCFAGMVWVHDNRARHASELHLLLTLRALRSLRKSGALTNVRWWTKDSMDQAVKLLKEGPRELTLTPSNKSPAVSIPEGYLKPRESVTIKYDPRD